MSENFDHGRADLCHDGRRAVEQADRGQHEQDDIVVVRVVVETRDVCGVRRTGMSQRAEAAQHDQEGERQD